MGGSSPPGHLLCGSLIAIASALIFLYYQGIEISPLPIVGGVALLLAIASLIMTLDAWCACSKGGQCPECGQKNPVRPWSF